MTIVKRFKDFLHLSFLYSRRTISEFNRWRAVQRNFLLKPLVFYGHERIPSRDERSGGAMIKFQDLNEYFPNTVYGANILYLVNSALPVFPEIMARRAKQKGVLLVLNQNGVAYPGWHGPGWEKSNAPNRILLELADFVIYQSEFCKQTADKFVARCKCQWTISHNPVNTEVFRPVGRNRPRGVRLLLSGSHQHFYRIQTALQTLQIILMHEPNAFLTIAGRYTWRAVEKECIAEVEGMAQELGVQHRFEFSGGYSQDEAPALLQQHNILLHTKYNDPCPRLVTEAMACGLPIVYSKSGGVPELVGKSAGVGVPAILDWQQDHPPKPDELARAVLQVYEGLERYSLAARSRAVNNLDVLPWIKMHSAIFADLLNRKYNAPNQLKAT